MSNRIKFCGQCGAALTQRLVEKEGVQRLVCSNAPACPFIFYNNPTPVVGAIVEHGDSVVLVRNVGWPDSWFGLVTGFLEARECPRAGILREVKEEIGALLNCARHCGNFRISAIADLYLAYNYCLVQVSKQARLTALLISLCVCSYMSTARRQVSTRRSCHWSASTTLRA